MWAFSNFGKAFKIPSGFRRNFRRRIISVSSEEERVSGEQRLVGLRFCIWVALKFETLRTRESRNLVSHIFCRNDWFSLYWEALEHLKESGISITSESVRALIRAYSYEGHTEKALEAFGRMLDFGCVPDAHTYNTVLKTVLRKKDFLMLGFAVYNMMIKSNCLPDQYTYNLLIYGFCKDDNIKGAVEMLEEIDQMENVVTYTTILSGFCREKRVDDAFRFLNKMKEMGCRPDLVSYNVLIDGFCKMGRIDDAFSVVRLLERDGFSLNQNGYSSLIHALFKAGKYNEGHSLYTRMFKEGIMADLVLYAIMMRGLVKEGRVGEAVRMLDEIYQGGLVPDAHCYNAIIQGFCDIGLLDQARSLQLEISKHDGFHNAYTHTILICGMCNKGMIGEAREIFNQMEKLGCSPSVVTFNALINGLCNAGKFKEANLLRYKMEVGRSPAFFFRLSQGPDRVSDGVSLQKKVEQMCEAGQYLNAYKFLLQLADSGVVPDITTFNILITKLCKAGDIHGALKLVDEMKFRNLSPDSVTYGSLIDGYFRANKDEDVVKICDRMREDECQPTFATYRTLMTWLCRRRKVSLAFNKYLEYLKDLCGWEDDLINALKDYFYGGKVEQAIRGLVKEDLRCGHFYLAPYTILLIGFCQAQKLDEALIIFSVLDEFNININPSSCVHLISGLCAEKRLDDAVYIFIYALDKGFMLRKRICNYLLHCLLWSHDKKKYAFDLIGRMESSGYILKRPQERKRHSNYDVPFTSRKDKQ